MKLFGIWTSGSGDVFSRQDICSRALEALSFSGAEPFVKF